MNRFDAIQIAADHLVSQGFEVSTGSAQSESLYLVRPGRSETLRLSCHACRNPFDVLAGLVFTDDDDRRPATGAAYVGNVDAETVQGWADEAAADYDKALAEILEDEAEEEVA